jgi:hypothetical protein
MHLAVAVGTPTLALFLKMELARWGHDHPPHRMVDLTGAPDEATMAGLAAAEIERFARPFSAAGGLRSGA